MRDMADALKQSHYYRCNKPNFERIRLFTDVHSAIEKAISFGDTYTDINVPYKIPEYLVIYLKNHLNDKGYTVEIDPRVPLNRDGITISWKTPLTTDYMLERVSATTQVLSCISNDVAINLCKYTDDDIHQASDDLTAIGYTNTVNGKTITLGEQL